MNSDILIFIIIAKGTLWTVASEIFTLKEKKGIIL